MLPTLIGRVETRIALLGVLGGVWTLLLVPLLPTGDTPTGSVYRTAYTVLVVVLVFGIGWELVYHFLQQFRWEKDWPTLFGLITGVNEGIVVWLMVTHTNLLPAPLRPSPLVFLLQFVTTWLLVWLAANGPMRVVVPRWRFEGGRLL